MKTTARRLSIGIALIIAIGGGSPVLAEWNKGLEAYKAGNWSAAAAEFEEVTETNPDYVGGYYMLGLCQLKDGSLSAANGNLRKAVELDAAAETPNPMYAIALAGGLNQAKQYQEAYNALKPFGFSSLPANYRTNYALNFAHAANKTNRSGEAVNILNAQTRADSSNASLYQALGVAQSNLNDDKAAFAAFKRAYELGRSTQSKKSSGEAAIRSGISAARRGPASDKTRTYTAVAGIAESLANSTGDFNHYLYAGEAWLGAKQYQKALSWFEKAKAKKGRNALVHYYIGQSYTSLGQYSNALSALQQSLSNNDDPDLRKKIYNQMGYVHEKNRDFAKAKAAYLEAGNSRQASAMDAKIEAQAGNLEHEKQCREFKLKIDALALQAEEFEKLGDMGSAEQIREQAVALQREYAKTCG